MSDDPTRDWSAPPSLAPDDPRGFPTASGTHVGKVRKENQDACTDVVHPSQPMRLLLTADGMGGHRGGEVASRLAVESGGDAFLAAPSPDGEVARQILVEANRRIFDVSRERPEVAGMGSTGVALLLAPGGRGWIAHVGDSRMYRLRRGKLDCLTDDHSLVGELVRAGRISWEDARTHPRRNQLQRALGVGGEVKVDLQEIEVLPGDRFLICSDGMWGALEEEEVARIMSEREPEAAVRELIDRSVHEDGSDNVTVQVAVVPGEAPPEKAERPGMPVSGQNLALGGLVVVLLALLVWLLLFRG
ncbi:MAG: protein phosphatase 2C domain-containing protein [Myxococcota bacterium]|nr:protein phosphatase 2C domain-containing protein [Myxococcota bacterium]